MAKPHYRWAYGFKRWYFNGPMAADYCNGKYTYPLWLK